MAKKKTNPFDITLKSRMLGSTDELPDEENELDEQIIKNEPEPIIEKVLEDEIVPIEPQSPEKGIEDTNTVLEDTLKVENAPEIKSESGAKKTTETNQVEKDLISENKTSASEVLNGFTVAEDILTIPKIQGPFKRINYSIRVEMLAVIKELSKQSRMSSSLIVERIFEKYLVRDGLKDIISTLPKRYGEVKLDKNGVTEKKRDFLQIDIPIYYVEKIIETMKDLNSSYALDMNRGHLVDILLSDSIHIMAPSE